MRVVVWVVADNSLADRVVVRSNRIIVLTTGANRLFWLLLLLLWLRRWWWWRRIEERVDGSVHHVRVCRTGDTKKDRMCEGT